MSFRSMGEITIGDKIQFEGVYTRVVQIKTKRYGKGLGVKWWLHLENWPGWIGPYTRHKRWIVQNYPETLTEDDMAALAVWLAPNARGGNISGC